MKRIILFLLASGLIPFPLSVSSSALAGDGSSHAVPRYNVVTPPLYRHDEDVRRYNAAPNRYGYKGKTGNHYLPSKRNYSSRSATPVTIRTDMVSRRTQQVAYYDSCGRRLCRNMIVTMYKDVFSNGGSRIWQHITYSP